MSAMRIIDSDWVYAMRQLKPGWDSYKAQPISDAAIEAAKQITEALLIVPRHETGEATCG